MGNGMCYIRNICKFLILTQWKTKIRKESESLWGERMRLFKGKLAKPSIQATLLCRTLIITQGFWTQAQEIGLVKFWSADKCGAGSFWGEDPGPAPLLTGVTTSQVWPPPLRALRTSHPPSRPSKTCSLFSPSVVSNFVTPWTTACQAPHPSLS